MTTPPILDLVDAYRGAHSLERRIPELQARVREIYDDWSPPPRGRDEIRLLPGLTTLHQNEFVASSALGTAVGRKVLDEVSIYPRYDISGLHRSLTAQSRAYAAAFLYADAVVEPLHCSLL